MSGWFLFVGGWGWGVGGGGGGGWGGGCRIFDKIIIISFRKKLGLSASLERVFIFFNFVMLSHWQLSKKEI